MADPTSTSLRDKILSACDECRTRKLKCSGEPTGCSRCIGEGSSCHYSAKKTMGRPRKRRREEQGDTINWEGGLGTLENTGYNGSDSAFLDSDVATFPGTQFAGQGPRNHDSQLANASIGLNIFSDDEFNFQALAEPDLKPMQDSFNWDTLQDTNPYSAMQAANSTLVSTSTASGNTATDTSSVESIQGSCSCLGTLYSTLATFQSLPAPSFPYSMGTLRKATRCGYEVVGCQLCPLEHNTAIQNSMLLIALLQILVNEYAKLLKHIDERSTNDDRITFRMGEISPFFDQRHTGGPDCPMAMNIDLSGEEWRMLARKGVRQEVFGSPETSSSLLNLMEETRNRAPIWHNNFSKDGHGQYGDGQNDYHSEDGTRGEKPKTTCIQITQIDGLKRKLEALNL